MSGKTVEILEQLKSLTLLETAELVKQIEETFGVDASPPVARFDLEGDDRHRLIDYEPPETSGFDVVLEGVPVDKKIAILKVVRALTGLGLKEAKDFVESAPKVVKFASAPSEAEEIKTQLEAAGAKVSLK